MHLPPDVNESIDGFTARDGKIRFGLSAIKNVGGSIVQSILESREEKGRFESIYDFCERVDSRKLNKRTFESLIKSGSFDSLGIHRAKLMNSLDPLLSFTSMKQKSTNDGQHSLFSNNDSISYPELNEVDEWAEHELLMHEMDVLGFYVTSHPMSKYSDEISIHIKSFDTESIYQIKNKTEVSIAGVVRSLNVKHTKRGSGIFGNLVLEDLKGSVDIIIFNDLLRKSLPILEVKTEPIIVKGFAEPSDDRITIRATDIKSFKELRSESTIHISITDTNATRDKLFGLKKIVESYPGESLLHLHINSDKEEAIVEVSRYKVDIDKQFISEVESLLGEKSLRIS